MDDKPDHVYTYTIEDSPHIDNILNKYYPNTRGVFSISNIMDINVYDNFTMDVSNGTRKVTICGTDIDKPMLIAFPKFVPNVRMVESYVSPNHSKIDCFIYTLIKNYDDHKLCMRLDCNLDIMSYAPPPEIHKCIAGSYISIESNEIILLLSNNKTVKIDAMIICEFELPSLHLLKGFQKTSRKLSDEYPKAWDTSFAKWRVNVKKSGNWDADILPPNDCAVI